MDELDAVFDDMAIPRRFRDPFGLDGFTADRLLDAPSPDDAPPVYGEVARLVRALRGPALDDELMGEGAAVAAFAARVESSGPAEIHRARPRLFVAAALATVTLGLGTGLAAAGALPGAAQEAAQSMLEHLGIDVPGPSESAGSHPGDRGTSDDDGAVEADDADGTAGADDAGARGNGRAAAPPASTPAAANHGREVSGVARETEATGRAKGAEVSAVASGGKSNNPGATTTTTTAPAAGVTPPSPPRSPNADNAQGPPASTPRVSTPHGPPAGSPHGPTDGGDAAS
jgi:hypothetical protein